MKKIPRRRFVKCAGLAVSTSLGTVLSASPLFSIPSGTGVKEENVRFRLGLASYTLRAFPLDRVLVMARRLGLTKIAFKSVHLPLDSTAERIRSVAAGVADSGLDLYAGGVIYMKSEVEVRQAFAYAKAAGMKVIVGVCDHELLPSVDRCVREFDICMAIHNHGPTDKLYPTPESVMERVRGYDRRLGLCLDVGHTQRAGIDPSLAAIRCRDRLIDVHIKDVTHSSAEGGPIEIGRGVVDIPRFLRTLVQLRYSGTVSLEYEKDEDDPLPGASESIGFLRGVLAGFVDS